MGMVVCVQREKKRNTTANDVSMCGSDPEQEEQKRDRESMAGMRREGRGGGWQKRKRTRSERGGD